jgi:hypothetical protein
MPEASADAAMMEYQAAVANDVETCISEMGCQPILFVGSGLSKRYFSGPSWDELLAILAAECPLIDKDYAYYKQTLKDPALIGQEFAAKYQEWAWGTGKDQFPPEMFNAEVDGQAYIKFYVARLLSTLTPKSVGEVEKQPLQAEIAALQSIRPHALITTNYDQFLNIVFPEYQPVIGQNIIQGAQILTGELFKIHGCVSDSASLVLTKEDYEHFSRKKKYLSAKLLTYFSEHPLLFIGYSASDVNIRAILSDIDECLPQRGTVGSVIPNIYLLEWRHDMPGSYSPVREKIIDIGEGRSVRIKAIEATDFSWVFAAFAANQPLNAVSPKILRALLSRSYDLVRYDIPRKTVEADFQMLEGAVQSDESFAKLFGITTIHSGTGTNAGHPYLLTDIAVRVTGNEKAYWSIAQGYVEQVSSELKVNIKASDNRYHSKVKTGRNSFAHKYSNELLEIVIRMSKGEPYKIEPL